MIWNLNKECMPREQMREPARKTLMQTGAVCIP